MAVRFAISGDAPALSAVTIMLLAMARRLSTMTARAAGGDEWLGRVPIPGVDPWDDFLS
jgi:hypothetical protein